MRFENQEIEALKNHIDIVDFIGRYVTLTKKGNNFFGLCPFHNEKTPSFSVNADRQTWRCFGCGMGGNVIHFAIEKENLTFPEAMEFLAELYQFSLKPRTKGEFVPQNNDLYDINVEGARFFYQNLKKHVEDSDIKAFLIKRGLTPTAIRTFGLGYAENSWTTLLELLKDKGFQEERVIASGLALKNPDKNTVYDRFRGRIVFPILDTRGRVLGFGGRVLDDTTPKYLNSPETAIYHKGRVLYGLHLSKNHLKDHIPLIIVEGDMDMLSLYMKGIQNVAAVLGTALTEDHGKLIRRYTKKVVLCLDQDDAGQNATLRSIDLLVKAGLQVRIMALDGAKDPDEYIQKYGAEGFRKKILTATHYLDYQIAAKTKGLNLDSLEDKMEFLSRLMELFDKTENYVLKKEMIDKISTEYDIDKESLEREISRNEKKQKNVGKEQNTPNSPKEKPKEKPKEGSKKSATIKAEQRILEILLHEPSYLKDVLERIQLRDFENERIRKWVELMGAKAITKGEDLLLYIEDSSSAAIITKLITEAPLSQDAMKEIRDCALIIHKKSIEKQQKALLHQADRYQLEGNSEGYRRTMEELSGLLKKK